MTNFAARKYKPTCTEPPLPSKPILALVGIKQCLMLKEVSTATKASFGARVNLLHNVIRLISNHFISKDYTFCNILQKSRSETEKLKYDILEFCWNRYGLQLKGLKFHEHEQSKK